MGPYWLASQISLFERCGLSQDPVSRDELVNKSLEIGYVSCYFGLLEYIEWGGYNTNY